MPIKPVITTMKIAMTTRQRLMIESIIRGIKTEDDEELQALVELRRKIGFAPKDRDHYIERFPGLPPQLKDKVIDAAQPTEIEFDKHDLRQLTKITKGLKLTPDDAETWYFDWKMKLATAVSKQAEKPVLDMH